MPTTISASALTGGAPENFPANVELVEQLSELAASRGATVSRLAVARLLVRKGDIVPIPSSRHPDRVAQNIAADDVTLTDADLDRIAALRPAGHRHCREVGAVLQGSACKRPDHV
jgi:aryl-alcohol dehydrogenase-like predicted oxidoreductase